MLRPSDSALSRFTRDLTADARGGRLDPIRGRQDEIARVLDILLRQGKNNPALVGPAGVGKTAIAEGLAIRVASGEVPLALRGTRILALDHVSLLAGTTYRGQYEERVRAIVAETTAAGDVVLFVDELHNLIGQGTAMGAAMDAANMLKPALVRGDFRVIGATTDSEYQQWVCGDPALERRFQKIAVRELSPDETLDVLRARQNVLEKHHGVVIADEALSAALELTDRYVTDRMRPDRAIDALDEACAHTHATAAYSPRAESLILTLRDLRRALAGRRPQRDEARAAAPEPAAQGSPGGDPDAPPPERPFDEPDVDDEDDDLGRMARDSWAAIERFGIELESMLVGEQMPAPAPRPTSAPRHPTAAQPHREPTDARRPMAELEAELRTRLIEDGVIVRGHDVAAVVARASGRLVTWAS